LLAELKKLVPDKTRTAEVVMTNGYKTGFARILHVAGPIYWSSQAEQARQLLQETYKNVILKADQSGDISELATASISTGIYGYPLKEAAPLAIRTVAEELSRAKHVKKVIFAMFGSEEFIEFNRALETWKQSKNDDL
jgi:O-acetyl-ADP-ribose deacetylase